jgi:phosphoenolpyruvate carboxykinase (ATP)
MWHWWNSIVSEDILLHVNSSVPYLVERSIRDRAGHLGQDGALFVSSGKYTGRAADDKYVVYDEVSAAVIDWTGKVRKLGPAVYDELRADLLRKFHLLKRDLYLIEASAGAEQAYSLGVNLVTTSPVHALFCRTIMRPRKEKNPLGTFTIIHDADFEFDAKRYGLRSPTVIALNFTRKEILIGGTAYCGEIKKAIFTVMNTILPDYGVLPMHAGASADPKGQVSVFFGLSGTGKTTLSTDTGMNVIGDDEHGLSDKGIFNFEGGCYAKTDHLRATLEPEIYRATIRFGSLVENVVLDPETRRPDFDDRSRTENGRSTYPLAALPNIINDGQGQVPANFFFLSADALGVLPLVAQLDREQALYFFLLGYTAKVAGTEAGMTGITATFSHCFGAPFMVRRPRDYGNLLRGILDRHDVKVWLVNTGWFGGPYGVGKRYDLHLTRECIRAIQRGGAQDVRFSRDPVFNLAVPEGLGGIESRFFHPHVLWKNRDDYFTDAHRLKGLFDETYRKLAGRDPGHAENPAPV